MRAKLNWERKRERERQLREPTCEQSWAELNCGSWSVLCVNVASISTSRAGVSKRKWKRKRETTKTRLAQFSSLFPSRTPRRSSFCKRFDRQVSRVFSTPAFSRWSCEQRNRDSSLCVLYLVLVVAQVAEVSTAWYRVSLFASRSFPLESNDFSSTLLLKFKSSELQDSIC